jgi:hypothetical protein
VAGSVDVGGEAFTVAVAVAVVAVPRRRAVASCAPSCADASPLRGRGRSRTTSFRRVGGADSIRAILCGGNQSHARFGSRPGRNERTFELMPGLKMGLSNPAGTGPGTGQSDENEGGLRWQDRCEAN